MKKINKKGWIKIVEAFMAIVLLLGFLLIMIAQVNKSSVDTSLTEKNNVKILNGIETNQTLRNSVLSSSVPAYSNETFPTDLETYLGNNTLSGQYCFLYICGAESECNFKENVNTDVYSSEILITSNLTLYSPRKLKVFCYDV